VKSLTQTNRLLTTVFDQGKHAIRGEQMWGRGKCAVAQGPGREAEGVALSRQDCERADEGGVGGSLEKNMKAHLTWRRRDRGYNT